MELYLIVALVVLLGVATYLFKPRPFRIIIKVVDHATKSLHLLSKALEEMTVAARDADKAITEMQKWAPYLVEEYRTEDE